MRTARPITESLAESAATANALSAPAGSARRRARRRFLAGSLAGTGLAAAPSVVTAAPITLRFQSTWPARDIFHEYANDFAKKVNDMSGGRLRIEVLPAGAVTPAFALLDAVGRGELDGGHAVPSYWYPKNSAFALWGAGPAFGMDPNMLLAWHYYGGGRELLEGLYQSLNLPVVSFVYGPMPTQPLGWFHKRIREPDDLRGLRMRTVGLSIDLFESLGAKVTALASADIVPAMEAGLLDAAEFNNASSDRVLGFPDVAKVCMLQSFHQASEQFEILFNRDRYHALPSELRAIIGYAVQAASADMSWKAIDRYSRDYRRMRTAQGVRFYKTPDSVLRAQLRAWDSILEARSAQNPAFGRVVDSMRQFARRAGRWQQDTLVDYRMAFAHSFPDEARE